MHMAIFWPIGNFIPTIDNMIVSGVVLWGILWPDTSVCSFRPLLGYVPYCSRRTRSTEAKSQIWFMHAELIIEILKTRFTLRLFANLVESLKLYMFMTANC